MYLISTISSLQVTDVNHDARISALEENGGSGGSQNSRFETQRQQLLNMVDNQIDMFPLKFKFSLLIFADTIAFHSALTSYSTIPDETAVVFNEVIFNQGDGYVQLSWPIAVTLEFPIIIHWIQQIWQTIFEISYVPEK